MTELSQVAQDTITIIGVSTMMLILVAFVVYILIVAYKFEKPLKELKMEKTKLEIKLMENQLNHEKEKREFMEAQKNLMEKRAK